MQYFGAKHHRYNYDAKFVMKQLRCCASIRILEQIEHLSDATTTSQQKENLITF